MVAGVNLWFFSVTGMGASANAGVAKAARKARPKAVLGRKTRKSYVSRPCICKSFASTAALALCRMYNFTLLAGVACLFVSLVCVRCACFAVLPIVLMVPGQ